MMSAPTKRLSESIPPGASSDTPPLEKHARPNAEGVVKTEEAPVPETNDAMEVNEDDEILKINMNQAERITTYKIEAEGCVHEVSSIRPNSYFLGCLSS